MISIIFRTLVVYLVVTLAIRFMGKRQIGDMQPNELVVTLLISEIAAIPLQDSEQPILVGVMAIFILVILEILLSVLSVKSFFMRKILSGQSVVIIKDGILDQKALKNVRMTVLDLVEMLRGQDVFDISDVSFAVLEVNGNLSVFLKGEAQNVTLKDMKIKPDNKSMPLPVISDGKIIDESLRALNISIKDLNKILSKNRAKSKDVFLMTLDKNKNTNIINKR